MNFQDFKQTLWDLRCSLNLKRRLTYGIRKYQSQLSRKQLISRYLDENPVRKLQIGSGHNPLQGWLNTDLEVEDGLIYLDATEPLPLPDTSIDYIFSEHMFEHIPYQAGNQFLREANRILKSGGRIRIATPDLDFLIRLHKEFVTDLVQRYIKFEVDRYIAYPKAYTRGNVINNTFRNWGHQFIYDFEMLSLTLSEAGFTEIVRHVPKESNDPQLRGLESHGRVIGEEFNLFETIVVEASKP